jgi:uncharacterized protein (UPF0276 family)
MAMDQNSSLSVGVGLRKDFVHDVAQNPVPEISFFEIAPENYIDRGGQLLDSFEAIAARVPIRAHGLSLSIGGNEELDWTYLKKLKAFLRRYKIAWFSDHLCLSSHDAHQFHDLLPLPFTREAVRHVAERARTVQDFLEMPFALENVSYYLSPAPPEMSETDFIRETLHHSGVSLLLDVNNVYVNAQNHGTNAVQTLRDLAPEKILQIHIAGHWRQSENLIIDTHSEDVCQDVWDLLRLLAEIRPLSPVLIERDHRFPGMTALLHEVAMAQKIFDDSHDMHRASMIC